MSLLDTAKTTVQKFDKWGNEKWNEQNQVMDKAIKGDPQAQKQVMTALPMLTIAKSAPVVKQLISDPIAKEVGSMLRQPEVLKGRAGIETLDRVMKIAKDTLPKIPYDVTRKWGAEDYLYQIQSLATPNQQYAYETLPKIMDQKVMGAVDYLKDVAGKFAGSKPMEFIRLGHK